MLKEQSSVIDLNWANLCDICRSAEPRVYCRADSAYLCTTCDAEIHSANPLASRHHRVTIQPTPGRLYGPTATEPGGSVVGPAANTHDRFFAPEADKTADGEDEDEAASWLLLNPEKSNDTNLSDNGYLFGGEGVDDYLDLVEYNTSQENQFTNQYYNQHHHYSTDHQTRYRDDSVVPVRIGDAKRQQHNYQLGLEYETSKTEYGYPASTSHSVSVSSMDISVVPDSTISEVSISHSRPSKGTIDLFSSQIQISSQLTPLDRETRVLRYREKKKTRKFEKTIRYASRKAYAETRPRIKGRFAKRTDAEVEVEQMFSTTKMAEGRYGIVPSF